MEKLMKYVEEMQKEWINICRPQFQQYDLLHMVLISKSYWLIKWLVENNKIDLLQLDNRIALSEFNKVERVLMALSISDTPIDDILLYLK